jgi:four helix bundle protein
VSSNYRAARRGRSRVEFIEKLGVVAEEADETEGWLEIIKASSLASGSDLIGCLTRAASFAPYS